MLCFWSSDQLLSSLLLNRFVKAANNFLAMFKRLNSLRKSSKRVRTAVAGLPSPPSPPPPPPVATAAEAAAYSVDSTGVAEACQPGTLAQVSAVYETEVRGQMI